MKRIYKWLDRLIDPPDQWPDELKDEPEDEDYKRYKYTQFCILILRAILAFLLGVLTAKVIFYG